MTSRVNCEDVRRVLGGLAQSSVDDSRIVVLSEHLDGCEACRTAWAAKLREAQTSGDDSSERAVRALQRIGFPPLRQRGEADVLVRALGRAIEGQLSDSEAKMTVVRMALEAVGREAEGFDWSLAWGAGCVLVQDGDPGVVRAGVELLAGLARPGWTDRKTEGAHTTSAPALHPSQIEAERLAAARDELRDASGIGGEACEALVDQASEYVRQPEVVSTDPGGRKGEFILEDGGGGPLHVWTEVVDAPEVANGRLKAFFRLGLKAGVDPRRVGARLLLGPVFDDKGMLWVPGRVGRSQECGEETMAEVHFDGPFGADAGAAEQYALHPDQYRLELLPLGN